MQQSFDPVTIRSHFPVLARKIRNSAIVYLDSTATSLKPKSVIDAERKYYTDYTANIFRGIYTLSEEATAAYEQARNIVADFIGATDSKEIIFTRNTTESINLVLYSWVRTHMNPGDRIVSTILEHHSNFVPWQQWSSAHAMHFDIWDATPVGELSFLELEKLVTAKTRLVAVTAVSNVLGVITPVREIVRAVKTLNPQCLVLVDAAQAVPHMPVRVQDWGADFVAFSSHKMLGPTGVGVLWSKASVLDDMEPFLYGGEMIREVQREKTFFKETPHKFEAGTPHIAGVIGLGAAIEYLKALGMEAIRNHEVEITSYALSQLTRLPGVHVYGPQEREKKGGVLAFTLDGAHPHDIAQVLDEDNICIRSGNHCAMPLHSFLGVPATARASVYIYTTKSDIDALIMGLEKVKHMFS